MKKFIFSAIAAIGLLLSPSCSDENEALSGSGNEALVSFSVNLADGIQTKATIGDGTTATNLNVDVYEVTGETYAKIDNLSQTATFENKQATVNMTLVKGKEYGFVFWAHSENASIYDVDDQKITVTYASDLSCNNEDNDAFLAIEQFVAKQSFNREVTLKRPLAQLNYLVSQSDLDAATVQGMDLANLSTSIWISDAATSLNPFTNTVSGDGSAVTFTATNPQDLSSSNGSKQFLELPKIDGSVDEQGNPVKEKFYYLATTYFLVNAGDDTKNSGQKQALVNTKMTVVGLTADDYALEVNNVPVQWNHRTNIYGNLLTASGQFVVKIESAFDDFDNNYPNVETVSSVEEIQTALANGSTTIKAAENFTIPADGIIPVPKNSETTNNEEISFDFSAITNNSTLTFEETNGNKEATAKNVSIIANGNVVINLPQSSVTLNGEYYNQVEATTAPNSLYIERGVTVNTLIAKEGNVHIKGTINTFTKDEGYNDKIYYYISTAEQLKEFAGVVNGTVSDGLLKSIYSENPVILLDEDIDLRNEDWTPIGKNTIAVYPTGAFAGTFDGQNHTISNLKASSNQPDYATAGLFGSVTNATIKNIKLNNVTVSSTHYAGAIVGYHGDNTIVTIENCHVDGGTITSTIEAKSDGSYDNGDKAGGIVGHMSATGSVNDCSVNNVTIQGYRELGGIVGYAGNKDNVTGCQVSNVTLIQDNTYAYKEDVPTTLGALVGGYGDKPYPYYDGDYASAVTKIHVAGTAAIFKSVLAAAGSGQGDQTIFITNDIDFTNADFLPVNVDGYNGAGVITVEGNNHKLTNLSAPLFAGGFAGNSGIVIKNLSIENSNITSTNSIGSGAFIESVDSQPKIELNNCHLRNSSVSGSRTGGLIGWTSGYNNENDGPVKTYVNILNCSVENSTITGSSVGGINGHAGANAWTFTTITNCTVTGCTLNSTDDGDWRVGVVVGTANVGQVTISGTTANNNTLSQTGKTAPEHSNLYGRFVPQNGSGKLTIDGVEITQ